MGEQTDFSGNKLSLRVDCFKLAEVLHLKESLASILGLKPCLLQIYDIKEGLVVVTFLTPMDELKKAFPCGPTFTQEQIGDLRILSVEWVKFVCDEDTSAEGKVVHNVLITTPCVHAFQSHTFQFSGKKVGFQR